MPPYFHSQPANVQQRQSSDHVAGLKWVIFKVQAVNLFLMRESFNVTVLCCSVSLYIWNGNICAKVKPKLFAIYFCMQCRRIGVQLCTNNKQQLTECCLADPSLSKPTAELRWLSVSKCLRPHRAVSCQAVKRP